MLYLGRMLFVIIPFDAHCDRVSFQMGTLGKHMSVEVCSLEYTTMALPMLIGGSDCGPSNPLQNLSKRFDQDRGIQQVRARGII